MISAHMEEWQNPSPGAWLEGAEPKATASS